MNELNIISQYTLAYLAGIICLVLILVQGINNLKLSSTYRSIFIFIADVVIISTLLYILFAFEFFIKNHNVFFVFRIIDYSSYALLLYAWINLLQALCLETDTSIKLTYFKMSKIISIVAALLFFVIVAFYMSKTYYIENINVRRIYHLLEIAYSLIASGLSLVCTYIALSYIVISYIRKFVTISTIFISLYMLVQIPLCFDFGSEKVETWGASSYDYSGWLLLVINVLASYFVYKKDFQKIYCPPEYTDVQPDMITIALDSIANAYKLTPREREIVALVYQGMSNIEISEILYISIHTVKSHMKNIYEKVDAASRMELVYIINSAMFKTKTIR